MIDDIIDVWCMFWGWLDEDCGFGYVLRVRCG